MLRFDLSYPEGFLILACGEYENARVNGLDLRQGLQQWKTANVAVANGMGQHDANPPRLRYEDSGCRHGNAEWIALLFKTA